MMITLGTAKKRSQCSSRTQKKMKNVHSFPYQKKCKGKKHKKIGFPHVEKMHKSFEIFVVGQWLYMCIIGEEGLQQTFSAVGHCGLCCHKSLQLQESKWVQCCQSNVAVAGQMMAVQSRLKWPIAPQR